MTDRFARWCDFQLAADSVYIHGKSVEARSELPADWERLQTSTTFVSVVNEGSLGFTVAYGGTERQVMLRSKRGLESVTTDFGCVSFYLDITGLSHHVWGPLLRAILKTGRPARVVYVEPEDYGRKDDPSVVDIFDLSERTGDINALPGFATIAEPGEQPICFVPLLGFEGARLAYVVEAVQPSGGAVVPIVGVPGFRPEYPFYTFWGNKNVLLRTQAWKSVRYAPANCPFCVFYLLKQIADDHSSEAMKIALIGTKPHALGAILYKLSTERPVELVYDYPVRRVGRSRGASSILVYDVSALRPLLTSLHVA